MAPGLGGALAHAVGVPPPHLPLKTTPGAPAPLAIAGMPVPPAVVSATATSLQHGPWLYSVNRPLLLGH
eukprot:8789961-Karenia_brevis.AAC.1